MVDAVFFVPLVIVALTQIIKMFVPKVNGAITIVVALVVGALVGLIDVHVGIADISVAQGIIYGLGAVGVSALASKAGGGARGDENVA